MVARRSVLFLIRDKLGDSLIAANVALLFARRNPDWDVSVMIRDAYAHPLAHETELKVIPYRSGLAAKLAAWRWRLTGRRFDVLGVMRGFGDRARSLIGSIPARRVIVHDPRMAEVATEVACLDATSNSHDDPHYGPAWRVAKALDEGFPVPKMLHFPGLTQRWKSAEKRFIAICPLSDELRRNMSSTSIGTLCDVLRTRNPGREVLILIRNSADLSVFAQAPDHPVREFHSIPGLIELLLQCEHYYGTDTGLLHLATAMGMPCTAFFGPTQPHRVLLPEQPNVTAVRTPVLGNRHCDVKSCTRAACIEMAVAAFSHEVARDLPPELPSECPLRRPQSEEIDSRP